MLMIMDTEVTMTQQLSKILCFITITDLVVSAVGNNTGQAVFVLRYCMKQLIIHITSHMVLIFLCI